MPQYLLDALTNTWTIFQYVCLIYCVGIAIETLFSAEKAQPLQAIGFNIAYTALFLLMTNLLVPPLSELIKPLTDRYTLAIPISFPDSFLGQLGQTVCFFFILDFFYYWFHRFQHEWPWFWSMHKIHHSEYALNITTGNRHHWLEEAFRVFFVWLPIGLLFKQKPVTIGWLWSLFLLWGYFIHMNLRLPLGPLTTIVNGPQAHRLHHSNLPEHHDRNYAAFFPVFDIVFGTFCKPKRGEYPTTGLDTGENLNGLLRASTAPFTDWYRGIVRLFAKKTQGDTTDHTTT